MKTLVILTAMALFLSGQASAGCVQDDNCKVKDGELRGWYKRPPNDDRCQEQIDEKCAIAGWSYFTRCSDRQTDYVSELYYCGDTDHSVWTSWCQTYCGN